MKWLKAGKNVMYAIDQDYGWNHSVRLKFFDLEAATITTTKKILDLTNSKLLFINSYYKNGKLILKLELIDDFGLDAEELAQKINDLMQEKILQYPALRFRFNQQVCTQRVLHPPRWVIRPRAWGGRRCGDEDPRAVCD